MSDVSHQVSSPTSVETDLSFDCSRQCVFACPAYSRTRNRTCFYPETHHTQFSGVRYGPLDKALDPVLCL